ncbi:MAG: outer membrane beta-barrel domain-containing protein [Myxococcaceae bacterium]|nr:outer membrane beta-barrel domain-containing protein [Myxococcaceae bacterium]
MMLRALPLVVLFALPAFAQKSEEEAGDVSEVDKDRSGPLKDRVTPVSGHLFLMKGRFEISPGVGFSFRDSFYQKIAPNLLLSFHLTETLGVQLRAGYAISFVSTAAQICTVEGLGRSCRGPTLNELDTGSTDGTSTLPYGRGGFMADLNLEWAPLYGKLGTLAVLPFLDMVNFNMYVALGPAIVLLGPKSIPIGGNVGAGIRFFINRFVTLRLELRDVIYYEQINTGSVRNQLFGELGISFFLPTDFTRE